MRVIAGTAKHLKLKTMEGENTRPTTDRIKETLFNMLSYSVEDSRFLDLFSGSGGIGIEALSRGAREAVFVELNRKAVGCIRDNLTHTHLDARAEVFSMDAMDALAHLEGQKREPFQFIFMDPPYGMELEKRVLEYLSDSPMVTEDTQIIIEASKETDFGWLEEAGYHMTKEKIYKTNKHIFAGKGE